MAGAPGQGVAVQSPPHRIPSPATGEGWGGLNGYDPCSQGSGGAQPHGAAHPQTAPQQPGEGPHHQGQHAPVKQEGRQGTHHQDDGQGAEGQYEAAAGPLFPERRVGAPQVAEYEAGTGASGLLQGKDQLVGPEKQFPEQRQLEQQQGQGELDPEAGGQGSPLHGATFLAQGPGQGGEQQQSEKTLEGHAGHPPARRCQTPQLQALCSRLPAPSTGRAMTVVARR
jgi:hypothetical protein